MVKEKHKKFGKADTQKLGYLKMEAFSVALTYPSLYLFLFS